MRLEKITRIECAAIHDTVSSAAPRVVIIGAGPGGLAAAILLSHAGCQVTVLERQGRVGGRTASIRAQGFRFDTGATFFLYPRVLAEIYPKAGLDLWSEIPMHKLDPHYRLVFGRWGGWWRRPMWTG